MYVYKICIKNFRNISDLTWKPNKAVNVIFGRNGCGKTNLAEALEMLFSPSYSDSFFDKSDFTNGDITKKVEIEVWLKNIETSNAKISLLIQHVDIDDNFVCDDNDVESEKVIIVKLESSENEKKVWSVQLNTGNENFSRALRESIGYKFVDSNRQPLKEITLKNTGILYQLSENLINDELKKISDKLMAESSKLLNDSTEINAYLEKVRDLMLFDICEKFSIMLKNPNSTYNYSGFELQTQESGYALSFDKHSRGKQNMFLLSLIKSTLHNNSIVFIEELEQNLEPINQRKMVAQFSSIPCGQVFITSHSPNLIEYFDYKDIFYFGTRTILSIAEEEDLKREIAKSSKKDFIAALMAERILLVEGESEQSAFPVYSSLKNEILYNKNTEVYRLGGKDKIKIYSEQFRKLEKKLTLLLDCDSDIDTLLNYISGTVDEIFLAGNNYEDMVYLELQPVVDRLDELVEFSRIQNKLLSLKDRTDLKGKQLEIHNLLQAIDIGVINTYSDLYAYEKIFKYILHDSFASPHFARQLAHFLTICPNQIEKLFVNIANPSVEKYKTYTNVYKLV